MRASAPEYAPGEALPGTKYRVKRLNFGSAPSPAFDDGSSSIAAFVAASELTLSGVPLVAGNGQARRAGDPRPFSFSLPTALAGKKGDAPDNGAATSVTCEGKYVDQLQGR